MADEKHIKQSKWDIRYSQLREDLGKELALFCLCAVSNVAYFPDSDYVSFTDYKDQMAGKKFRDGDLRPKQEAIDDEARLAIWKRTWGTGGENNPYDIDDFIRLDELFETYSSRLNKSGGMDEQQEDTLRTCCKLRLASDKCIDRGGKENIDMAAKLNKMIQDNLSSEQLRKKDAKPMETARVDGIVDAITKKYGVDIEMTMEQAIEACSRWLMAHKYPYTMDAAEWVLLSIINTTRNNNDMGELQTLPEAVQFPEALKYQFESAPNLAEKDAYRYLEIERGGARPLEPYKKEI